MVLFRAQDDIPQVQTTFWIVVMMLISHDFVDPMSDIYELRLRSQTPSQWWFPQHGSTTCILRAVANEAPYVAGAGTPGGLHKGESAPALLETAKAVAVLQCEIQERTNRQRCEDPWSFNPWPGPWSPQIGSM